MLTAPLQEMPRGFWRGERATSEASHIKKSCEPLELRAYSVFHLFLPFFFLKLTLCCSARRRFVKRDGDGLKKEISDGINKWVVDFKAEFV